MPEDTIYDKDFNAVLAKLDDGENAFASRLNKALDRLRSLIGADSAHLFGLSSSGRSLKVLASYRPQLTGSTKKIVSGSILERIVVSKDILFIPDRDKNSNAFSAKMKSSFILAVPVLAADEKIKGILWFSSRKETAPPNERAIGYAREFASRIAFRWQQLENLAIPMFNKNPQTNIMEDLFSGHTGEVKDDLKGIADLVDQFTEAGKNDPVADRQLFGVQPGEHNLDAEGHKIDKIKRTYYLWPDVLSRMERIRNDLNEILDERKAALVSKSYLVNAALDIVLQDFDSDPDKSVLLGYIQDSGGNKKDDLS